MNTPSVPIVFAKNLCRGYQSGSGSIDVLKAVSFEIQIGQHVALVGRSGSGKTTLLNLLSGLDRPTSGHLLVGGQDLRLADRRQLAEFRLRKIGVIFQSFQLIQSRTAFQNVELPLILAGIEKNDRQATVRRMLKRVGLTNRATHFPGELSGGEQQRVAIARSIVNRPRLLLADEPTGNLDTQTTRLVMELLIEVAAENDATLFLITHDKELAVQYSKCILQLVDGELTDPKRENATRNLAIH